MSEVMRWKLKGFLPGVEGMSKAVMKPFVVLASDYDALAAQRDEGLAREAELLKQRDALLAAQNAAIEGLPEPVGYVGAMNLRNLAIMPGRCSVEMENVPFRKDAVELVRLDAITPLFARLQHERDVLQQRLAEAEKKLDPVDGDLLPAVGSKVFIHLARSDSWAEHTVVGYYAWDNHGLDKNVHRIFVRVRDSQGYLNACLLNDIRFASPGCADGEQPS